MNSNLMIYSNSKNSSNSMSNSDHIGNSNSMKNSLNSMKDSNPIDPIDITSIGDINLDIITSKLKGMPDRDSQVILDDMSISSGGCAANFARAIGRLGLNTRFIGRLGNDIPGEFVKKSLAEIDNIDLKTVTATGKKTGVTLALTFDDDTRSFVTYPGSNREFSIEDIDFDLIGGRYLHIASFFLQGLRENTTKILDYAHDKGMVTSFDTGWDPAGWSEKDTKLVRKVLKDVDIFFPNLREAAAITNCSDTDKDEACDKLLDLGPGIIALKMGSSGSYIATQGERILIEPFDVNTVDTTGAGDVFNAAFVFGRFNSWDLKKTGKFANAAAALSTTGHGTEKYPCKGDVNRLIKVTL